MEVSVTHQPHIELNGPIRTVEPDLRVERTTRFELATLTLAR